MVVATKSFSVFSRQEKKLIRGIIESVPENRDEIKTELRQYLLAANEMRAHTVRSDMDVKQWCDTVQPYMKSLNESGARLEQLGVKDLNHVILLMVKLSQNYQRESIQDSIKELFYAL